MALNLTSLSKWVNELKSGQSVCKWNEYKLKVSNLFNKQVRITLKKIHLI